jgi:hypothetical protein
VRNNGTFNSRIFS